MDCAAFWPSWVYLRVIDCCLFRDSWDNPGDGTIRRGKPEQFRAAAPDVRRRSLVGVADADGRYRPTPAGGGSVAQLRATVPGIISESRAAQPGFGAACPRTDRPTRGHQRRVGVLLLLRFA